jgi:hypothetical protein
VHYQHAGPAGAARSSRRASSSKRSAGIFLKKKEEKARLECNVSTRELQKQRAADDARAAASAAQVALSY